MFNRASGLLLAAVLASGLPITAAASATAPQPAPARFTLPAPTGHHRIGTTSVHLVDESRPDPWVPDRPVRELMIQIWYPAVAVHGYPKAPWISPATAAAYERANGLPAFNWPITAAHLGAPAHRHRGGWPVVLYSHGLGGHRGEASALVEDLASHGYIVVAIDHIHDAVAVELPDGRVETGAIPELTEDNEVQLTTKAVESRVADTRFVLDQLTAINRGTNPLPRGLRGSFDLDHIGMFGHSDGGATTAHAMHTDARITAGINLDGTLWTPAATAGSNRPLLLFGKQDLDQHQATTWASFWTNHRGPKLQLNLTGSTHATFEDFATLLPQAAPLLGISPEQVAATIGTINPQRALTILRTYTNAYFNTHLRHRNNPLLNGPSPHYPEVRHQTSGTV